MLNCIYRHHWHCYLLIICSSLKTKSWLNLDLDLHRCHPSYHRNTINTALFHGYRNRSSMLVDRLTLNTTPTSGSLVTVMETGQCLNELNGQDIPHEVLCRKAESLPKELIRSLANSLEIEPCRHLIIEKLQLLSVSSFALFGVLFCFWIGEKGWGMG